MTLTVRQENLGIYGSADFPWSVPLAQLESGRAERFWPAAVRPPGTRHRELEGTTRVLESDDVKHL